jgi:hypothetical protein
VQIHRCHKPIQLKDKPIQLKDKPIQLKYKPIQIKDEETEVNTNKRGGSGNKSEKRKLSDAAKLGVPSSGVKLVNTY